MDAVKDKPLDVQLIHLYDMNTAHDVKTYCMEVQAKMCDVLHYASMLPERLPTLYEFGNFLVEDKTDTTKTIQGDIAKCWDNVISICDSMRTAVDQFVYHVDVQLGMAQLKKAEMIDVTMQNVRNGKAIQLTPKRREELLHETPAGPAKRKKTPSAPKKGKKARKALKLDLSTEPGMYMSAPAPAPPTPDWNTPNPMAGYQAQEHKDHQEVKQMGEDIGMELTN